MNKNSYWEQRQKELNSYLEQSEKELNKRLAGFYQQEFERLSNEIAGYYAKYGKNNVIEYKKLLQSLSKNEVKLLYEKAEEFIKKHPDKAHLLPVRESIYKLNRLTGLQYSAMLQQYELGAITENAIREHLENQAKLGFVSSENLVFSRTTNSYNPELVKEIVNSKWTGENKDFSDFVWGDTQKLTNSLNNEIAQAFARGDSYKKTIQVLQSRFEKVGVNNIKRLVFTEGTFVTSQAGIKAFEPYFLYYKTNVRDDNACEICKRIADIDSFKITEQQSGVNFPPIHPWCRCGYEILKDDNYYERNTGVSEEDYKRLKLRLELAKADKESLREQKKEIISRPPDRTSSFFGDCWDLKNGYFYFERSKKDNEIIVVTNNVEKTADSSLLIIDNDKAINIKKENIKKVDDYCSLENCYAVKINKQDFKGKKIKKEFNNVFFEKPETFDSLKEKTELQFLSPIKEKNE